MKVPLHRVAHARAGDKGNRLNVSLIVYAPELYEPVRQQMTAERVASLFASRRPTKVVRYELPKLHAFNFVLDDVLDGGVNASLGLDGHGKSLSFRLLNTTIEIEPALVERLAKGEKG